MRTFVISLCMFVAACGGQTFDAIQYPATATSVVVVIEGDSLSALSTSTWPITVQADSAWPNSLWFDVAIAGTTTVDMANRYGSNVRPLVNGSGIFTINGGTNDIRQQLPNPVANTYANLQYLWGLARHDGFKVIAFTIHSTYTSDACATCESDRLALNDLIRSDPSLYDAIVPMDQIFPDINDATLLYDKLHFTPAGNAKVAAAIDGILAHL